jgi:hypothetical protein
MFERAITGLDIATGTELVDSTYVTVGTKTSDYREGNGTIQFEVIPVGATDYNTTINEPNPFNASAVAGDGGSRRAKRGELSKKKGKRGLGKSFGSMRLF